VVERLRQEVTAVLAQADVKAQLSAQGIVPLPGSSAEFGALMAAETQKWSRVVKTAGVKIE
jgi:tripartite-type tricarboxylate transporter receptor subunit TctC